jgi:hypothetical protein
MTQYQLVSHYVGHHWDNYYYGPYSIRCLFSTREHAIRFYNRAVKPDKTHTGSYLVRIKEHVYA